MQRLMERELSAPSQVFALRHPNGLLHRFEVYEEHTRYMLMQESLAVKDEWEAIHTRLIEKPFSMVDVREYLGLDGAQPYVLSDAADAEQASPAPLEETYSPQNLLRNTAVRLIQLYESTPSMDYGNRLAILKELREVGQALYSTAPLEPGYGSFSVPANAQPLTFRAG